jgi:hypothetical protein
MLQRSQVHDSLKWSGGRRRRTIAVIVGLAIAGGAAIVLGFLVAPGGESSGVSLLTEQQRSLLVSYARGYAREVSDPTVSEATVLKTRYGAFERRVNRIYGGKPVNPGAGDAITGAESPDAPVFVVELRGKFTDNGASTPMGGGAQPTGTQILAVLETGGKLRLLDWYVLGNPLSLTGLGQTTTLPLAAN